MGDYSMSDKIRALRKIDEMMGCEGVCDEAAVQQYIEEVNS